MPTDTPSPTPDGPAASAGPHPDHDPAARWPATPAAEHPQRLSLPADGAGGEVASDADLRLAFGRATLPECAEAVVVNAAGVRAVYELGREHERATANRHRAGEAPWGYAVDAVWGDDHRPTPRLCYSLTDAEREAARLTNPANEKRAESARVVPLYPGPLPADLERLLREQAEADQEAWSAYCDARGGLGASDDVMNKTTSRLTAAKSRAAASIRAVNAWTEEHAPLPATGRSNR